MEKKTFMQVIVDNKGKIIKGILIGLGTAGAVLGISKLLNGQEEVMIDVPNVENDNEPVEVVPEEVTDKE